MANLDGMTNKEFVEQGVRLGIYTPDGFFTEEYGGGDARLKSGVLALTELERQVLAAILDDRSQFGVPPTAERISHLVETARPSQVLASLIRKGYVRQPYKGGPYVPLRRVDGSAVS